MPKLVPLLFAVVCTSVALGAACRVPPKPVSVAVADVNLDGYPDIVVGHNTDSETGWGGVSILLNDGTGHFSLKDSISLPGTSGTIGVANIDADPRPEIFAVTFDSARLNEYIAVIGNMNRDSVSLFQLNRTDLIDGLIIDDLNHDGHTDVIFWSNSGHFWGILPGDGKGGFSAPEYYDLSFPPTYLAVGDLNGDGRDDIVMPGSTTSMLMYINNPGGFDTLSIATSPMLMGDIKIADMNNDGRNEIVVVQVGFMGTPNHILIYSGDGGNGYVLTHTSQPIKENVARLFIADLNNDGYPDIIYNSTPYNPNSDYELFHTYVLLNNKDGTLQDPVNYFTGVCSFLSYAADLNGDGWRDLITLNSDFYNPPPSTGSISVLLNDGTGKFITDSTTDVSWHRAAELGGYAVYAFAIKATGEVFAGTGLGISFSTDAGQSWIHTYGTSEIPSLTVDLTGNIYAGTSGPGIYRSTDNGTSWVAADSIHGWISALTTASNGDIFAGCMPGGIYISTDRGVHWEARDSGLTSTWVYALAASRNGSVFAGTATGVCRSTDNGTHWISINAGLGDSSINCLNVDEDAHVFCGTQNAMYLSTNNGDTWAKTALPTNQITSIVTTPNGEVFAGTFQSGVYHSTNQGATWTQMNGGFLYPSIMSLALDSTGHLLAGSMGSEVYRSVSVVTSVNRPLSPKPQACTLYQNYPNPFNPTTVISFELPTESLVSLRVYDLLGREVATLMNGKEQPGRHQLVFDASNYRLSTGLYIVVLKAGENQLVRKMMLVK